MTFKGKKHTEESKKKNSISNSGKNNHFYGKKHSDETIKKLSESHKGQIPWNKGIPRTDKEKNNISNSLKGKGKGIPKSMEHKRKISESNKNKHNYCGSNNPNWKGGISTLNHLIRTNPKTIKWIKIIFERDNYTCKGCKQIGYELNVHHIKPLHQILKDNNLTTLEDAINCLELWDLSNGVTLCKKCHDKINKRRKT